MAFVYSNIEAERARKGMTRTALSESIGVSLPTYNRYIDGSTPIPSDKLVCLAKLFGCTADYLLNLSSDRMPV